MSTDDETAQQKPPRRMVVEQWDIPEEGPWKPVMPPGSVESCKGLWVLPDGELVEPIPPTEAP